MLENMSPKSVLKTFAVVMVYLACIVVAFMIANRVAFGHHGQERLGESGPWPPIPGESFTLFLDDAEAHRLILSEILGTYIFPIPEDRTVICPPGGYPIGINPVTGGAFCFVKEIFLDNAEKVCEIFGKPVESVSDEKLVCGVSKEGEDLFPQKNQKRANSDQSLKPTSPNISARAG